MYPGTNQSECLDELGDWYQFYLIPGAAHCSVNSLQPGPYPQNNMEAMIDWVESGLRPSNLNATVSTGAYAGEVQKLCSWPLRPYWSDDSTFDCFYDDASVQTWTYNFDAFGFAVY